MLAAIAGATAAGFFVAVLAAVCFETGYALQALEARKAPGELALKFSLLKSLAKRPIWLLAIGLTIAGWPLQLWALSLAPITVVQPTLALGLVLLLILGVTVLHEHVGARESSPLPWSSPAWSRWRSRRRRRATPTTPAPA